MHKGPLPHELQTTIEDGSGMKGLFAQVDTSLVDPESKAKMLTSAPAPDPEHVLGDFAPFAVVLRQSACRHGPAGWPLPGVGCWVRSFGEVHGVLLELESLKGAGMHEYNDFNAALDHRKFRTWKPVGIRLSAGYILWIPYGQIGLLSTTDTIGSFLCIPWFNKDLAIATTEDLWSWIAGANIACGNKNPERSPWKTVLPALRNFTQGLFT